MTVDLPTLLASGMVKEGTVRLARHLGFLYGEDRDPVIMAVACAITALEAGSVCFDLARADQLHCESDPPPRFDWPDPQQWAQLLASSELVSVDPAARDRPVVLDRQAVYLTRYWAEQQKIVDLLSRRLRSQPVPPAGLAASLDLFFGAEPSPQRAAAEQAATRSFCVVAGGPGTGKTTVVARILATLATSRTNHLRVILTAPTGRAAARLEQAVRENLAACQALCPQPIDIRCTSGTLHRILGLKPWGACDHDAAHPLAADMVVVDEASMLSLHLMTLLLDAIPDQTRLVLLGDADQLASVEAGAVLADIVANAGTVPVTRLTHTYRFSGALAELADAIRRGDEDEALTILEQPNDQIEWVRADLAAPGFSPDTLTTLREDVTRQSMALIEAGQAGDAATALRLLDSHRLLVAHRHGDTGVGRWTHVVRQWIARQPDAPPLAARWYPGLPVLITRNDDLLGVFNGDCGVVVRSQADLRLALDDGDGVRFIAPDMIESWESLYASTIHKAQGSQYDAVSLILPGPATALLTRELFYTAVTRAKSFLRIIGTPESVRHAIASPALRASGLASKLAQKEVFYAD